MSRRPYSAPKTIVRYIVSRLSALAGLPRQATEARGGEILGKDDTRTWHPVEGPVVLVESPDDEARRLAKRVTALEQENQRLRSDLEHATHFTVCALPEHIIDADAFAINVVYRGRGLWAVTRHDRCLSADGVWGWEPGTSGRDDDWLAAHRFDLDTALGLAKEAAPHITVNGHTVADALEGDGQ